MIDLSMQYYSNYSNRIPLELLDSIRCTSNKHLGFVFSIGRGMCSSKVHAFDGPWRV